MRIHNDAAVKYQVSLTENAKSDIEYFDVRDQRIIVAGIINHLKIDAETETRRKKPLRSNPIATWELRLDKFRVFYIVERKHEKEMTIRNVKVVAVGHKEHNEIFIRGRKVLI